MVLSSPGPDFDKASLDNPSGYLLLQKNSYLEYYNTRFVRLDQPWKCVGVTHEYWDSPSRSEMSTIPREQLFIIDIGDGGSKHDKYTRDIQLLTDGIKKEPKNERYYFYLAQSYKDIKDYEKAIDFYKKRISLGGWEEEVWYSHYMIAHIYAIQKNDKEVEWWGNKAFELRPQRVEPLYLLTKYFREACQYFKAMHYFKLGHLIPHPTKDLLFVEPNVYKKYLFDYEYSIIHFYVYPNERIEGLKFCLNYINEHHDSHLSNVPNNLQYYMPSLVKYGTKKDLNLKKFNDFSASSISLIEHENEILANVRYVNYRIEPNGSYMMQSNGEWSHYFNVRTKNALLRFDKNLEPTSELTILSEEFKDTPHKETNILGIEDLRLFKSGNKLKGISTSREFSVNTTNSMVVCDYDTDTSSLKNLNIISSPNPSNCEKNWIPIEDKIIYGWSPLVIGEIKNNNLELTIQKNTPFYFKYLRGSSNVVEYKDHYWCIVHGVIHTQPRKYYHSIVILDKNLNLRNYSVPFYFEELKIEYCLGIHINENHLYATVSRNDSNPMIVKVNLSNIKELFID
jgi:tetratricopeptide (TPR) repeat protein